MQYLPSRETAVAVAHIANVIARFAEYFTSPTLRDFLVILRRAVGLWSTHWYLFRPNEAILA